MSVRDSLVVQFLDLVLCAVLVAAYGVLVATFGLSSPGIALLGGLLVGFVPGYAIVSALFPKAETSVDLRGDAKRLTFGHRVVLSVGTSFIVGALLGLVLASSPTGLFAGPTIVAVGALNVVGLLVAAGRRWATPPDRRFSLHRPRGVTFFTASSGLERIVTALLVVGVLVAFGGIGYAVVTPDRGETFTGFSVLTQNDTGELVASNYPTNVVSGESSDLYVEIANEEKRVVDYTVVVLLQSVDEETGAVTASSELRRFEASVPAGETATRQFTFQPDRAGENQRVQLLLYRGSPPTDPTRANAYRSVHFWTTVSATGQANASVVPRADTSLAPALRADVPPVSAVWSSGGSV
ncbi:hypothetical protein AUR64_07530 [Haloprofundus marisrubri]|uniref:DUF1616 domain-containing protein n=1 Tax=Haloprofundus marisrubri TaxID=1514971 RepID=A0A0W1RC93_9EURY|nr:DUF1616 domain-containing protein [Haloprofundus marisrubri]KTG11009.1 hypothetical protein AUR64_07530 [Haloprofundus marisrubri]